MAASVTYCSQDIGKAGVNPGQQHYLQIWLELHDSQLPLVPQSVVFCLPPAQTVVTWCKFLVTRIWALIQRVSGCGTPFYCWYTTAPAVGDQILAHLILKAALALIPSGCAVVPQYVLYSWVHIASDSDAEISRWKCWQVLPKRRRSSSSRWEAIASWNSLVSENMPASILLVERTCLFCFEVSEEFTRLLSGIQRQLDLGELGCILVWGHILMNFLGIIRGLCISLGENTEAMTIPHVSPEQLEICRKPSSVSIRLSCSFQNLSTRKLLLLWRSKGIATTTASPVPAFSFHAHGWAGVGSVGWAASWDRHSHYSEHRQFGIFSGQEHWRCRGAGDSQ